MVRITRPWAAIILTLGMGAGATPARACGQCSFALVDRIVPPVHGWTLLAISLPLSVVVAGLLLRRRLPGTMHPLLQAGLTGAAVVLSGVAGPLLVWPAALPAMRAAWRARRGDGNDRERRVLMRIGTVHAVAALALLATGVIVLLTRTRADYIVQWGGTAGASMGLRSLTKDEPASLPDYRDIVMRGGGGEVAWAARRLGAIGDPVTDGPLLESAAARLEDDAVAIEGVRAGRESLRARAALP